MYSVHELIDSVGNLISLPDVYFRVRGVINDSDSTMADVANAVACDPNITARLLRVANSPFFGLTSKIETVTRAVNTLGTRLVHDIVLATSIVRTFYGISNDVMNMDVFWYNSVYCGVTARILATRCNVRDSERLFVEGLLRDIGHLVMYLKIPDQAQQSLVYANDHEQALYRVERELIGFDYAEVGGALMNHWKLPDSLVDAVRWHPQPEKAQSSPIEASIIHIAGQLIASLEANEQIGQAELQINPVAWEKTGLSEDVLEPVIHEAGHFIEETMELLFPKQTKKPTRTPKVLRA
jgi:HD-like signal output (HDOD) protein